MGLDAIVRHVDYIASRIGVDHVAFGSDFEGAPMPADLGGVSGLPRLVEAIAAAGYDEAAIAKITHGNWLRVLDDVWKPWARYYRRAGFDARPTLLDAVGRFPAPGVAVDLGAGTGRDTLELLRRGWRVVAIDGEPEAVEQDRPAGRAGRRSPRGGRRAVRVDAVAGVRPPERELRDPVLPARPVSRGLGADRRLDPSRRAIRRAVLRPERRLGAHGAADPLPRRGRAAARAVRDREPASRRMPTGRPRSGRRSTGISSTWSRGSNRYGRGMRERVVVPGLTVSVVGVGCNNFGWRLDVGRTRDVVDEAIAAGITLFDTAESYGDGESEEFLGRAIAGRRERVVIATKFGWGRGRDDNSIARGHPDYVRGAIEGSLQRLGTDYVDLYQYHRPDGVTPIEETLGAMSELVDEGKVRFIGSSNFSAAQVEEAAGVAAERGFARFVTEQSRYSWLERGAEDELIPACERLGVALLPVLPAGERAADGQVPPRRARAGGDAAVGAARGLGRAVVEDRGARAVRGRSRPVAARDGDRLARGPADGLLGDRRGDVAGAGARERRGCGVGALGGRARRAARALMSESQWQAMAPRWERGTRAAVGLDAAGERVARLAARSAAGAGGARSRGRDGGDGVSRRGASRPVGAADLGRPGARDGRGRRAGRRRGWA